MHDHIFWSLDTGLILHPLPRKSCIPVRLFSTSPPQEGILAGILLKAGDMFKSNDGVDRHAAAPYLSRARVEVSDNCVIVLLYNFYLTEVVIKFAGTHWAVKGRKNFLSLLQVRDGGGGG